MMYFSEKEEGERPRENEDIGELAWGGIRALISARIEDGSFGATYPTSCPDGSSLTGTNADALWRAMQAEVPSLRNAESPTWYGLSEMPRTLDVLDMVQFCWRCVGQPIPIGNYHGYWSHHHLRFEVEAGREKFREDINRIFRRNALAYELKEDGSIERLVPPVMREALMSAQFRTRDAELNRMLEAARSKILSPDEEVRREALEKLWDAWERLKTLGSGPDKKAQARAILDDTAGSAPRLRDALDREAKELTQIGNEMQIRHSEKGKERVAKSEHVDYLFHRMFCLIQVILRMNEDI